MMRHINGQAFFADPNNDGTYSIHKTDHQNLSKEEFDKLTSLMGGHWVIFCDYSNGNKNEEGTKTSSCQSPG